MFLVMSRPALYVRGDFAVEFRSESKEACEEYVLRAAEHSRTREWVVVDIVLHIDGAR